jgi:hypothetical protein
MFHAQRVRNSCVLATLPIKIRKPAMRNFHAAVGSPKFRCSVCNTFDVRALLGPRRSRRTSKNSENDGQGSAVRRTMRGMVQHASKAKANCVDQEPGTPSDVYGPNDSTREG